MKIDLKKNLPYMLMFISAIMLFSAMLYYDFSDQIANLNYSDSQEYDDIKSGLAFLDKFPIHFNIINKYFSNFDNLSDEEKEEIIMGFVVKNNYKLYSCGPNLNNKKYMCINKSDLNTPELLSYFSTNFKFKSFEIKVYLDDYGATSFRIDDTDQFYKFVLNDNYSNSFRLYSEFNHYKKNDDIYTFYLRQGYYTGNCKMGEELKLYDFMTGNPVYVDKCNGNNNFQVAPGENVNKLQLYKYELKKDKSGRFYLFGYNPVNNID